MEKMHKYVWVKDHYDDWLIASTWDDKEYIINNECFEANEFVEIGAYVINPYDKQEPFSCHAFDRTAFMCCEQCDLCMRENRDK